MLYTITIKADPKDESWSFSLQPQGTTSKYDAAFIANALEQAASVVRQNLWQQDS